MLRLLTRRIAGVLTPSSGCLAAAAGAQYPSAAAAVLVQQQAARFCCSSSNGKTAMQQSMQSTQPPQQQQPQQCSRQQSLQAVVQQVGDLVPAAASSLHLIGQLQQHQAQPLLSQPPMLQQMSSMLPSQLSQQPWQQQQQLVWQQWQQQRGLLGVAKKKNYQDHNKQRPKKYKIKTPPIARRRVIVGDDGIMWRMQAGRRHKRYKKSRERLAALKGMVPLHHADAAKLRKLGFKKRWWYSIKS